ncbi:MAG: LysM peptidoglycan-binding domain-containing protein, partial [Armatimonadota bacterium]|nr:LysM peptidoglycan-binding domain-containing protein [Armatimonadota bacterium]
RGRATSPAPFGSPDPRYGTAFARDVDAITSYDTGAAAGRYTVRSGDTLAGIAQALWGDASLWYTLAGANGLGAGSSLDPGQVLTVPAGVVRSTYTASTFTPYDPSDTLGDVSPVTAQPTARARKNKCGAFGQILLAAVAMAVTIALPGSGFVAGALNGAIGSAVSQGVGLATGIQDRFSFKGVALSAIGGGISGGIGELAQGTGSLAKAAQFLDGGGIVNGIARGVVTNIATQGIAIATGLQSTFDFAGVAVAGVVGGVGNWTSAHIGGAATPTSRASFGNQLGASMASALAGAATRSVLTGTDFGDNVLAVLPDVIGSTIGSLVAEGVAGRVGRSGMSPGEKALVAEAEKSANRIPAAEANRIYEALVSSGGSSSSQSVASDEIVVTAQRRNESVASSQGPSSTLTGLALTREQYLDAVKNGLWKQIQGVKASATSSPNNAATTGFSNDAAVDAAAKRAQAMPSVSTADLQASPDLAAFVKSIASATAGAKIGGSDQDYEKFLTFGRNAADEIVVTAISIPGKQGGSVNRLLIPGTLAIAHVHYQGLEQPPHRGDNSVAKARNLPSFVIGSSGRNVWEIGRVNGNYSIRSVLNSNKYGNWEAYQIDPSKYKTYSGSKF